MNYSNEVKKQAQKALKELNDMGLYSASDELEHIIEDYGCLFYICAENGQSDWLDYWAMNLGEWGNMSDKLTNTLERYGLYAEWLNAGIVGVYKM